MRKGIIKFKTLDEYFIPPCNISYERHISGSCKQNEGDPMDSYVTSLEVLAETCDLGDTINDRIRDQVVQGCFSNDLRRILLKNQNLTLNKILMEAKTAELSEDK